ncbi:uncharacterized protein F4812DRAFT_457091 [Daldinia caldariorum]|uniref:uncharacterized protein n=1 Tax=Daldinia caldariorum TaxID=326644 RepID=UPI002007C071|nr:uncharacterized protein F4812DRAFT_457091 [Daldinia caldariorum]KAI1469691.1 hypothetical protein F4812DRAFT_457091 [Daldinia caldariorum]
MEIGLDELIESLLTEIAFSGVRGCSVSTLLKTIDSFYNGAQEQIGTSVQHRGERPTPSNANANSPPIDNAPRTSQDPSSHEFCMYSKVWGWLVSRADVSVGTNRQFNHRKLEEILALPEEEDDLPPTDDASTSQNQNTTPANERPSASKGRRGLQETVPKYRPRLHVSDERQWKTIAGHGPDLKRLPFFEWKALVDIASVREKGILQGDLVRLSGQDKRSLPTRTDALAKKGYIIKQPIILRGCRSSKLWLARFADNAKENRDGLNLETLDLSKETLTKDLRPVPFSASWNGERLDYIAIAQAFNAVIKAWGIMRYCDVRTKLDANRVPQMRALAKTSRWFTSIGAVTFVAARFANGQRLFKDCVKFIREPTAEEWRVFRTTPSAHIRVPSARLGKRGQASRARFNKGAKPSPHSQVKPKQVSTQERQTKSIHKEQFVPSLWTPYKPMVNTTFEIIKRAGPKGSSNLEIGRQTLGHSYRKYIAALTGTLSLPNSQPPHLQHLNVTSQLNRIGKTMTYQFFANGEVGSSTEQNNGNNADGQDVNSEVQTFDVHTSQRRVAITGGAYTYSQIQSSKLMSSPASFSQLHDTFLAPRPQKNRKRKRGLEEPTKDPCGDVQEHPKKVPRIETASSGDVGTDALAAADGEVINDDQGTHLNVNGPIPVPVPTTSPQQSIEQPILDIIQSTPPEQLSSPPPPSRPSGVYREPDNSLDPPGRKGRRKKSLVLTLKCNSLKAWLEGIQDNNPANLGEIPSYEPSTRPSSPMQEPPRATLDNSLALSEEAGSNQAKLRPTKRGSKTIFRCDKCGNSWKNSNGLDYHLNKSRTTCNPAYTPTPAPPPRQLAKLKEAPKAALPKTPDGQEQSNGYDNLQVPELARKPSQRNSIVGSGRRLLPHKRVRFSENLISSQNTSDSATQEYTGSSIILQDVDAYDVIDHRKRRENSQATLTDLSGTIPPASQVNQRSSHMTPKKPQNGAPNTNQKQEISAMQETSQKRTSKSALTRKRDRTTGAEKPESYITAYEPYPGQTDIGNETPAPPDFNLRINLLKPVVPIARAPSRTAASPAVIHYNGSNKSQDSAIVSSHLDSDVTQSNQSSPKKPRKSSTLTVGTIRKDRTTSIIEHLLDRNDGVFPGQRSLYLAIVSLWVKRYSDIEPPDWKVCQNLVNKMEKAGALAQHRFFFLDDNGKLQECCVLTKSRQGAPTATDLAADPKVETVKEKMREMHPEPYIPEEFSLSQDESELFDALASKYRDSTSSNGPRKQLRKSNVTEDIEVLQYQAYVVNDASTHAASSKRPAEEDESLDIAPAKKIRVDDGTIDKSRKTPKPRKRGDRRESWATAKVAKYIWNQKQNPGDKWAQKHACLQNFATSTWSNSPQEATSMRLSIDMILSSLRTSREKALLSMGRLSSNEPNSANVPKENSALSPGELLWNHDSIGFGNGESYEQATPGVIEMAEKSPVDRFVKPSISTSFIPEDLGSEEEDDDTMSPGAHHGDVPDESLNQPLAESGTTFVQSKLIRNTKTGCWPWLPVSFFESNSTSFTLAGAMPEAKWFQLANLPQNSGDIFKSIRGKFQFNSWADPSYGKFLREVGIIERWEQSAEGSQILLHGSVAPDYIFISLSSEESKANMKPIALEWPSNGQYTAKNIPDEIKNATLDDENAGLSMIHRNRGRPRRGYPIDSQPNEQAKPSEKKPLKKIQMAPAPAPQAEVQYKTRSLRPIPIQHRGRVSVPRPNDDNHFGLSGETEVIAAFVVFKTLLGGVDRKADIGSILKAFPKFSHSALRKFWPRVSRERKTYIDALTEKFQSAFLEAYEAGEVEPLNYDDIDSYDWQSLILWATKLETHDKVELPGSRHDLEDTFSLEDVDNEATDWRETWFQNLASIYSRVEATSSEPISIPLTHNTPAGDEVTGRARSWVRSLCVTPIRGAKTPEEIRTRLLSLSDGNEAETNRLLKKAVDKLISERVASRSKGKILGQSLRLHGVFAKHLEKPATVEKFAQSANFKTLLDESFREGREFLVPYVADEGTIMAIFNLQALGRIHAEAVDIPNIPFGFEPGNYDGRTFPKSYYHFNVRLLPTESYVYNEDLPVLQQVGHVGVPLEGARREIPIWVDFFGNLDKARWITYLSMTTLALATKGPLTAQTASVLLKPFVEPFEAKLIMDWIDGLGILKRYESGQSATVGEWWWLVVGQLALDVVGRGGSQT